MKVMISNDTLADLQEIWTFIAQDNPSKATEIINKIYYRFDMLPKFPYMGTERSDILNQLRFFPFQNYRIFYSINDNFLEIYAILSKGQDIDHLIKRNTSES